MVSFCYFLRFSFFFWFTFNLHITSLKVCFFCAFSFYSFFYIFSLCFFQSLLLGEDVMREAFIRLGFDYIFGFDGVSKPFWRFEGCRTTIVDIFLVKFLTLFFRIVWTSNSSTLYGTKSTAVNYVSVAGGNIRHLETIYSNLTYSAHQVGSSEKLSNIYGPSGLSLWRINCLIFLL